MFSWFVANKELKLHVRSRFHEYNFNFHKFDIIINKMMAILLCSTAVQGISIWNLWYIRTKNKTNLGK